MTAGSRPCSAQRARCSSNTASTAESANVPVIKPCIAERCDWIRAFSSAVAARVKVMMSILLTETSSSATKRSTRCLMEKVFPVPAEASSKVGRISGARSMSNDESSDESAAGASPASDAKSISSASKYAAVCSSAETLSASAQSCVQSVSAVRCSAGISAQSALSFFAIVVLTAIPHQSAFLEQRSRARQGLRPYKGLRAPSLSVRRKPQPALGLNLARR